MHEAKIDERGIYTWRIAAPYKEGLVTIHAQIIIPSWYELILCATHVMVSLAITASNVALLGD